MAKKRFYDGAYAGKEGRRMMEEADSGMIKSDFSATANLPQQVMMKDYPKFGYGMREYLDDTSRGIDKQMADDRGKEKKEMYPEKY